MTLIVLVKPEPGFQPVTTTTKSPLTVNFRSLAIAIANLTLASTSSDHGEITLSYKTSSLLAEYFSKNLP